MMQTAILDSAKQFAYLPVIKNKKILQKKKYFIVLGMGGSHLAADLLREVAPALPLIIFSDYGLPRLDKKVLQDSLIIASSYSGNTQEVISGFLEAQQKKLDIAVIAVGGKLIDLAIQHQIPYIQLPNTGIQPRLALGFSLMAMLRLTNQITLLKEITQLSRTIKPSAFEEIGKKLATSLVGHIPVIYTSRSHASVAYNWKIKFNENTKIPAFCNYVPELNHNEMNGFDHVDSTRHLSEKFAFVFLVDKDDHPKNKTRMRILKTLYEARGFPVHEIELKGKNIMEKTIRALLIADWASVHLALEYGIDPESVPMVEEFKRLVK
ncbi:MAG: bifunctional phosphoglucose/phosphomannose isomerase [Candidatus Magasanikbacteria bacterium]|nr:bifunctional phosphoglucose/phosphomannose isomerase [Candidatus Magasanikbacteria bacterium]